MDGTPYCVSAQSAMFACLIYSTLRLHPWSLCYSKALKLRPPILPESEVVLFLVIIFNVRP